MNLGFRYEHLGRVSGCCTASHKTMSKFSRTQCGLLPETADFLWTLRRYLSHASLQRKVDVTVRVSPFLGERNKLTQTYAEGCGSGGCVCVLQKNPHKSNVYIPKARTKVPQPKCTYFSQGRRVLILQIFCSLAWNKFTLVLGNMQTVSSNFESRCARHRVATRVQ